MTLQKITINLATNHPCGCARWDDSPQCPECYPAQRPVVKTSNKKEN